MPPRNLAWSPTTLSEASYAPMVGDEIVERLGGRGGLRAAPIQPSTRLEASLGWDLNLKASWVELFLQYKVSAQMTSRKAGHAAVMGVPYYRFYVKTDPKYVDAHGNKSWQHNVLCELEERVSAQREAFVYYVAPAFTFAEWDRLVIAGRVADRSVGIRPMVMGPVDADSRHCFAYTDTTNVRPFSSPGPSGSYGLSSALQAAGVQASDPGGREQVTVEDRLRRTYSMLTELGSWLDAPEYTGPHLVAYAAARLDLQAVLIGPEGRDAPPPG